MQVLVSIISVHQSHTVILSFFMIISFLRKICRSVLNAGQVSNGAPERPKMDYDVNGEVFAAVCYIKKVDYVL